MSALEKFSLDPVPARHLLRALPAQNADGASKPGPIDTLIRLAERLLPSAVFVLDRGHGVENILTWPPGVMGRRGAIDPLARILVTRCPEPAELWISDLATSPLFEGQSQVHEAGPLGFARLPLPGEGTGACFGVIRERGEWSEEERSTLRDLAAALAAECERERLAAEREAAAGATPGSRPRSARTTGRLPDPVCEVGPLLREVCHELNNPLTSIKSFAELLLLDVRTEDDREALEIMLREARRASHIVADLRRTVRREAAGSGHHEPVGRVPAPSWSDRPSSEESELALSLVQSRSEHDGEISAAGGPDEGPGFSGGMPGADAVDTMSLPGVERPARHRLRVLVVDDEAPIRYSLARYMERRGHEVDQAGDGADALRMLGTNHHDRRYDIIVADLSMPEVNGDGLLECLRARGDGLEHRLILMTGAAHSPSAARHLQEAGIPVMWKPFELAEVAQVIEAQAGLIPM